MVVEATVVSGGGGGRRGHGWRRRGQPTARVTRRGRGRVVWEAGKEGRVGGRKR